MSVEHRFDNLAERATERVTRWWFFALVSAAVLAWIPTLVLWDTGASDLFVDAITNPLSLVLLVLLQNSQRRSQVAQDRRQDALEESLAVVLDHFARDAASEEERRQLEAVAEQLRRQARESTAIASGREDQVPEGETPR